MKLLLLLAAATIAGCRPPVVDVVQPSGEVATAETPIQTSATDWPAWRGPGGAGQALGPPPPVSWSDTENVLWRANVPGEGHASPIVCGERVFVASADESGERQLLVAFDRRTGDESWQAELHRGGLMHKHAKNSHASATPACDGRRVYCAYIAEDALWVAAVTVDGETAWKQQAGPFRSLHGYGSSPVLFENLVIVAGDNPGGSYLAALHRDTGQLVWRQRRSSKASFGTPLLVQLDQQWQLLHSGHESLISYDPGSGDVLWRAGGPASTTANTPVHRPGLVVVSGGYPQRSIMGIRDDGSGQVLWEHSFKAYVPSPLLMDDHVLVLQDNGVARFFDLETGDQAWQQRLRGDFSASPVRSGPYVFVPNEDGLMYVLKPTAKSCEIVAENRLEAGGFASPAICDGRIYVRTRNWLYCIGPEDAETPGKVAP